ncbi:AraC-type DNA-binding protein [Tenacibaculum sp. MAR_2009_124]|uniref:helix-turn-helix transcriptional regulator n=1 Tax=Tenacibaculum sp. MAR_2009_124 TaxID=1250059 RepID=UPI00089804BB|nr:AraC family transcriptional regulator [Tenacibaculum sp. MAR_2009_124]SEC24017.1 AraC-type DNA-binding protein [Tenacibaculum sp. MAR_2009_124]
MKFPPYKSTFSLTGAINTKKVIRYPLGFSDNTSFEKTQNKVCTEFVDAIFDEYLLHGAKIEMGKVNLKKDLSIDVKHNFPFFKMHFEIEGSSSYSPRNEKSLPVIIPNGYHQLFFFPKVDGVLSFPANITRNTLEITLSLSFVHKVFKDNWEELERLGDAIRNNQPFVFGEKSHKINSEMLLVIQQIANCKIDNHYRTHYLECKIIELLILQLQDFKDRSKDIHIIRHHDKIVEAKSFIEENISGQLTISSIAKKIGMNTQDLKKEFKINFGQTIFKFITARRMELAEGMLKSSSKSVYEIAEIVGYKYSQHFTKAFKKYFGVNPSTYRKET